MQASPSPAKRERKGPAAQRREGEGIGDFGRLSDYGAIGEEIVPVFTMPP
jgi:hypothetical protein